MSEHSESVNGVQVCPQLCPQLCPHMLKEDARHQEKRDAALALCCTKSDRTRKLAASQQSPYTANSTARVIIPNKNLYPDDLLESRTGRRRRKSSEISKV
ncbi:hypothetical protein YC2023_115412 [Brassica napus]